MHKSIFLALVVLYGCSACALAGDWVSRGYAAMAAGHADDGLASFRQALKLDENAPVPAYARAAGNR